MDANEEAQGLDARQRGEGLAGMLDRSPTERLIMAALLKGGPATSAALIERLDVSDSTAVTAVIAQLVADGALLESNGVISVVHRRVVKPGARAILDRLGDL